MKYLYKIRVLEPKTHIVKVALNIEEIQDKKLTLFIPSWSPGSYLMREYARHLSKLQITTDKGIPVYFEKTRKGTWLVDLDKFEKTKSANSLQVSYEVYCHELTVRTSHIDESHAFLHGPSYLMGAAAEMKDIHVEIEFSPLWSKLTTGLKDISQTREKFIYWAQDYDELLDCPIEIGCQETDGFMVGGKEHHLAFYGQTWPHQFDLKSDMKKIVEYVSDYVGEIPYEKYYFITHFIPHSFGGLEHRNSTALIFDGRILNNRKDYINWLALVAHEYFHTWNVKRIRPAELGPFNYTDENYTQMLWLAEGLTSFMDNYFVYKSGLCTGDEYWELIKADLNKYYKIEGRRFDSLEESSFDAWIKLYRPHENSKNSTISYYLKGGLVFLVLHARLLEKGKSIEDLVHGLWSFYKKRPDQGMNKAEFLELLENLTDKSVSEEFQTMISTTEDIDFEKILKKHNIELQWKKKESDLAVDWTYKNNRVFVGMVQLDGPAYRAGLNAGDEIIAINATRVLKEDIKELTKYLKDETPHRFLVCRNGSLLELDVMKDKSSMQVQKIEVKNNKKW
ncbi:MAG: PDZ domain-containing protein [Halobacteriovoraceae bacterium]|nr:PDZ domain-containing protein [Halobacteriovoraceae bacterium]